MDDVQKGAAARSIEEALGRVRAAGERLTPGRRAVIAVLARGGRHLDAEAVAGLVAEREPGVHRATIYRSLQALVDVGVVSHTHVPGAATIYHLAASDGHDRGHAAAAHAHLQCVACERFLDVDAAEFAGLAERIEQLTGFVVDPTHGALLGVCRECRAVEAAG